MENELICPRCGGKQFEQIDCGPDGYEDDITYISDICEGCGLYHSGWTDTWLIDCNSWQEEESADEYISK